MQLAKQQSSYKQTEAGIIPADWDVRPFGEFSQFRNGLNFIKSDKGDIVKVVGVSDFQSNFSITEDHLDSVQIAGSIGSDDLLKNDDLLFVRSNGNKALIGRCVLIQGFHEPVSFSGFTIRGRVLKSIASPQYVARYFHSNPARRQIKEAGEGSHISNLSQQVLASLKIPLPTLAEQEAIASALSDADGLIELLEKLIAKKRQIKNGAMQELLTGKRRLPGFSGNWEAKRLGEIGDFYSGGTPNTAVSEFYGGDIPWITSSDCNTPRIRSVAGRITEAGVRSSATKWIKSGTVLMALYGATAGVVAISEINATINQAVLAIVLSGADPEFMFQKLRMMKEWIITTYTQGGQPNLSGAIVKSIELTLPSLPEQHAIAAILSDMDADVVALESKLTKARQVKQGMMQELLTGRVRLV